MSKPSHPQFSPEIIAQIAAVIVSQPVNFSRGMSFQDACARAYNLLLAAQRSITEREAAATKDSD
ncbi:MAG: hypothetical protein ACYDDS_09250 [Candidatus Sulfotelmatobacter sp.]